MGAQMGRVYRFLTIAVLVSLGGTPNAFSADSPCFSERSCAATTLNTQSRGHLETSCEVARAAACADIKDPEKLYSCSLKSFCERTSLDAAIAGSKGCALGVFWEGSLKIVWDVLKGLYVVAAHSSNCNSDIEQKLDLIDRFNESLPPGESFKTPPKESLQRMSCVDLLKAFDIKTRGVAQRIIDRSAADVSKEINPVRTNHKTINLKEAAERVLDQFQIKRECYNTEALLELYCEAGTITVLSATGVYSAFRVARVARLAELSGSTRAQAAASEFARAGKVSLSTAGSLSEAERVKVAETLLGRSLSKEQQEALIAAHRVGQESGAGYFTYTEQQLRDKARMLRSAGFTPRERAILMRNGIAGTSPSSASIKTSMSQAKTFKMLPAYEQQSRLATLDARDKSLQSVESLSYRYSSMSGPEKLDYLRTVRGLADTTRIAGESAASVGDLTSAQALTKEALARFERVMKDAPQLMSSPASRDTLLEMKIRSGDIEGAAKTFVENAKIDFQADGVSNAAGALNERFFQLKARAESGPSQFVLRNERGTERYIATGRPIAATNASSSYLKQIQELKTLDKILESKPTWLVNVDYARERARIQSLLESAKRELRNRGYNPDQF